MANWFTDRFQFAKALIWRPVVAVGAAVIAIIAALQAIRGELPQDDQKWLTVATYLPAWPWYVWIVIILAFLLVVVFEAAFRLRRASGEQFSTTAENVANRDFLNESIDCDGKMFHSCRFTNVTLRYSGYGATGFVECKFFGTLKIVTKNKSAQNYSRFIKILQEQGGPAKWQLHEQYGEGRLEPVGLPELRGVKLSPRNPAAILEPYYIRLACMRNDLAAGEDPVKAKEIFDEFTEVLDKISQHYGWESLTKLDDNVSSNLSESIDAVMVKIRDKWKSLVKPKSQETDESS